MSNRQITRQWRKTCAKRKQLQSQYAYVLANLQLKYASITHLSVVIGGAFYSGYRAGKQRPSTYIKRQVKRQLIDRAVTKNIKRFQ